MTSHQANPDVGRERSRPSGRTALQVLLAVASLALVAGATGRALGPTVATGQPYTVSVTSPRVVVLKSRRVMHLFDGDRLIRTYPLDLGLDPSGPKRRAHDGRTPLGTFRVVTKNPRSEYQRFIGLDYPDLPAVEWGLRRGLISPGEARAIREALAAGRCPNWATGLGGGIGIHGGRRGEDWTGGCMAVSDTAVEELYAVLRIGDTIEILP